MTRVFIWKNNCPQEWEEISFTAFRKARSSGAFSGRFFIETTKKVDGHNERVITECSRARYETHRQELGTINQDVVQANSPKRHDTYVYYFADGSRSTLVLGADDASCVNGAWIAELRELDRLEYNNQHTQTRRHCSLDAQDPEGMGGYYTGDDNIWTLDGDGELRLTIMATMAQEESRKISERSLAGQRVSREKGVLYGNGNIFGYTRNKLTKQFEIDPDQAETVKMIFDLYDSGMGETLVAKELTRLGRKNGVGKVKWDAGKVSKIIKRKNYLGYTVYCQSYSNNYLEQKRIKRDESEFVYVKGGFPQIISEEQYERCNAIRRSRTKRLTDEKGRTRSFGIQQAQNVWGRKMRCRCGSPMLRHRWRTNNAGKPIYGYECKRHHDTPRIRLQNEQGNPTPICEIKPVGQSKLELMASKIFERVWGDQREIVLQTCKMLDACYKPDADRRADLMKAKDDSIQLLQQQLDDLVVVRARGEIEQDKFLQRTIEIQQQMEALRQSKAQIASEDYNPGRLDMEAIEAALCEAVEMHDGLVSEDFIDLFVSQVTPLSDSRFAWCLDFSPQPTVAFLNLAGQRKYTTCSMDSKLHFGPFADEEGHTIPFPGSLRR